jgi:hypothetical protein
MSQCLGIALRGCSGWAWARATTTVRTLPASSRAPPSSHAGIPLGPPRTARRNNQPGVDYADAPATHSLSSPHDSTPAGLHLREHADIPPRGTPPSAVVVLRQDPPWSARPRFSHHNTDMRGPLPQASRSAGSSSRSMSSVAAGLHLRRALIPVLVPWSWG